jgi:hypothetical protein
VSDQPSPSDKSKAHVETVYQKTHREVDQDSTDVTYGGSIPKKSTGWSPMRTLTDNFRIKMNLLIYESMPSIDDYRLQHVFSRICGSTAQSSDSARVLELGKYNHFRET